MANPRVASVMPKGDAPAAAELPTARQISAKATAVIVAAFIASEVLFDHNTLV